RFRCTGVDGVERFTCVAFRSAPAALAPNEAVFVFRLAPRQTWDVELEVAPRRESGGEGMGHASRRVRETQDAWLGDSAAAETSNEALDDVFRRSLLD